MENNDASAGRLNLTCLVVDDERPALEELAFMLEQSGYCQKIVTSDNVLEALRKLQQEKYDLVMLDVQMPGMNGIELVQVLQKFAYPPGVIFVTAYEEYAVQAFGLEAVDYLLKPVAQERLLQALERFSRRQNASRVADTARREDDTKEREALRLDKLPVDKENRTLLIDLNEIRYAVARGDYVYIKTFEHEYLTRFSISELERRLPSPPFMRTHRAFLVNLHNVNEIQPFFNGAYVINVNDKERSEVQVSRGHARSLRTLLGM